MSMASGHDRMIDGQRSVPVRRHAHDHDLVAEQLDTGRAARPARPDVPVVADLGVAELAAIDLAERQRRRRARLPPATGSSTSTCPSVATVAPRASASAMRATVSSGHFTWTKCTAAGSSIPASRIAARTASATMSACGRRPRCSGGSAAVWARPSASAGPSVPSPSAALEHGPMGRHAALGAARHHQADFRRLVRAEMALEHQLQRERRVAARVVVDEAVALGLAEHRDRRLSDRCGLWRFRPRCR